MNFFGKWLQLFNTKKTSITTIMKGRNLDINSLTVMFAFHNN